MPQDDFVEEVQRLRESYQRKAATSWPGVAPYVDGAVEIIDGVLYETFWFEQREGHADKVWAVRLADIPGSLSGNILRLECDFPITHSSFEVVGNDIRPMASVPSPPYFPDDDEDVTESLAALPVVTVDPDVHFVKKPKYASEITHNLACLGGTCPGIPKSPHIVPLLGRSADGELVFPRLIPHWVLNLPGHPFSAYKTWILNLIEALRCLHALGIVHRDIRPSNFVWSDDYDRLFVCDLEGRWGNFSAPEAARLYRALESRDSAAVVLDELSAGWTTQSDVFDVGMAIVDMIYGSSSHTVVVERPVPRPLDEIVAACTRESPAERPSLDELYEMVQKLNYV